METNPIPFHINQLQTLINELDQQAVSTHIRHQVLCDAIDTYPELLDQLIMQLIGGEKQQFAKHACKWLEYYLTTVFAQLNPVPRHCAHARYQHLLALAQSPVFTDLNQQYQQSLLQALVALVQPALAHQLSSRTFKASTQSAIGLVLGGEQSKATHSASLVFPLATGIGFAITDQGIDYKDWNEDAIFINPKQQCFGVLDGLGGYAHGQRAVMACASHFAHCDHHDLRQAVLEAKQCLVELPDLSTHQAGCCLSMVHLQPQTNGQCRLHMLTVGDTRILILRDDPASSALTAVFDTQSQALELLLQQQLLQQQLVKTAHERDDLKITEQLKQYFANRHRVSQVLNADPRILPHLEVDVFELLPGDWLLMGSDGVFDNIVIAELNAIYRQLVDPMPHTLGQAIDHVIRSRQSSKQNEGADVLAGLIYGASQTYGLPTYGRAYANGWVQPRRSDNYSLMVYRITA